jgi:predicted nucleic acid-binding protein
MVGRFGRHEACFVILVDSSVWIDYFSGNRKTADVIIASYCIEHKLPLLFSDKDFQPFVEHMGLRNATYI